VTGSRFLPAGARAIATHPDAQNPADGRRRPPHRLGNLCGVQRAGMAARAAWSRCRRRSRAAWTVSAGAVAWRSSWSWRVSRVISVTAWAARASSSRLAEQKQRRIAAPPRILPVAATMAERCGMSVRHVGGPVGWACDPLW
jgi:hypothetical protein